MTLIMNGKTIDPKAIDHTDSTLSHIIADNIEDTMCQLADIMGELGDSYDSLCELLSDAGMDTKNAIFTAIDGYRGVLTVSGLDTLKGATTAAFTDTSKSIMEATDTSKSIMEATDTSKSTADAIYTEMLRFHDSEGREIEDNNEFYYGMAKAIVRILSKQ